MLAGLASLCGCNKDIRVKTEKIDELTQRMFAMQQEQARQLADMHSLLAALPVQLDKTELDYFVKGQEKALFYQTNVLYLLLAVDKKIQVQFEEAARASDAAKQQAYIYHTNETELAVYCASQVATALAAQEKRVVDDLNTELQKVNTTVNALLTNQSSGQKSQTATLQDLANRLARLQQELDLIQARLPALTNAAGLGSR